MLLMITHTRMSKNCIWFHLFHVIDTIILQPIHEKVNVHLSRKTAKSFEPNDSFLTFTPGNGINKPGGEDVRIRYDLEKLKGILQDYTRITGLSIAVLNQDREYIAVSHGPQSDFCKKIQENSQGALKCRCSDMELLERCAQSGHAEVHLCHAGLADAAIPLVKDQITLGYVILGRIRRNELISPAYRQTEWFRHDAQWLEESYRSLTCYDDDRLKSVINLATAITTYILVDDMVKMEYNQGVERAASYIRENLKEDLSVENLCAKLNLSKSALYEQFRMGMNTTVSEFVTNCRLERAKELLRESTQPLAAVAEAVGIDNYTYFIKIFKKRTGLTPLQYRKQN